MNDSKENKPKMKDGIPIPDGKTDLIDTDYVIGQDNIKASFTLKLNLDLHGKVFLISSLTVVAFILFTLIFPAYASEVFSKSRNWLISNLDWFFLSASNIFLITAIGLIISPLGKVRLGGSNAKPEYSYAAWLAMLFAAGMGIGLMFYGVAEPISHYTTSIAGTSVENGVRTDWAPLSAAKDDIQAATSLSMAATMYHWGLHAWGIYAIVALALALYTFNKGLPMTIRSIFYPIFGERVWGWIGNVIDILAVFATLFGLTTSLGIGAGQAASGIEHLFGIEANNTTKILLIIAISCVALYSVIAGMDKGVKKLSEFNMGLAMFLLVFVILAGPTLKILSLTFNTLIDYLTYLPQLSNPVGRLDDNYRQGWSSFYWAWWISWSPFVGMFIARVSRGRSVREFLIAVIVVPTLLIILWMSSFGGSAMYFIAQGAQDIQAVSLELKLFALLDKLPLSQIMSFIGVILIIIFFVTSSDSGSLVIDSITAGGKLDAPVAQRVFWVSAQALVAIALLLGGGLSSMQASVIATGFPFAILVLVMLYSIILGLIKEPKPSKK